jgi:glycosyltransferase involved in cell wall biosynthesis
MRRIVLGHQVGVLFEPHDPRDIARALNSLLGNDPDLEKMKDNARRAAQLLYNWEKERHVLVKLYGDLVSA